MAPTKNRAGRCTTLASTSVLVSSAVWRRSRGFLTRRAPSRQTLLEPRDTRVEKFAKRGYPNAIAVWLLIACDNRRPKNRRAKATASLAEAERRRKGGS